MNDNFIYDLCFGRINIAEQEGKKSQEKRKLEDKIISEVEYWHNKLNNEDMQRLDDLFSDMNHSRSMENDDEIVTGFIIGAKVILEIFRTDLS